MARTEFQFPPRIVKNGGPITSDVYKAYYSSGATSEDWYKGQPLSLRDDGTVTLATDSSGIGTGGANVRFIALTDHDSSAEGESVFVTVQEITQDTVFEGQLNASSTGDTTPVQAMIGDRYDVVLDTSAPYGWGPDVDDTTNPACEIVDVEPNWQWMRNSATEDYGLVRFKFLESIIETAPTS